MNTLLLLLAGAGIVLAVQAIGLLVIRLAGEDVGEAASYWYALTAWAVWVWLAPIQQRRRRMKYQLCLKSPYDDPYEGDDDHA